LRKVYTGAAAWVTMYHLIVFSQKVLVQSAMIFARQA
jgi:hypothetical protein